MRRLSFSIVDFFRLMDTFHEVLFAEMAELLKERNLLNKIMRQYIQELKEYSLLRKINLFKEDVFFTRTFHFDFPTISSKDYSVDPANYKLKETLKFKISHNAEQKK